MFAHKRWEDLVPEVVARHRVLDGDVLHWFKRPARIRIALYAEGPIAFRGGAFVGLQRVVAALRSDPWPWVVFEPVLIHRGADPSADQQNKTLDQIDLSSFDELWLFGYSGGNLLSQAELDAVHAFMDAGGGVLHTGDHADLGQGIAGAIKRAGEMRLYPAPPAAAGVWNNTLRPGADGIYEFDDQSDGVPQDIRLRWYTAWGVTPPFYLKRYPHPVLCGGTGPIRIFPDHQHEGEALAPASYPEEIWPRSGSFQPRVEVIAWGRVESPDAGPSREIGLVSVYDGHSAEVGRIVADSTWHHWFDINLEGFAAVPGQAYLGLVERYFLNVAAWLAPRAKQQQMRDGVFLIGLRRDPLVMLNPKLMPPWALGGLARDALGQIAPQCLVRQWILDHIPPLALQKLPRIVDPDPPPLIGDRVPVPVPLPIEDLVLASAVAPLLEKLAEVRDVVTEVDPAVVKAAFAEALPRTARLISAQVEALHEIGNLAEQLAG